MLGNKYNLSFGMLSRASLIMYLKFRGLANGTEIDIFFMYVEYETI